MTEQFYKQLVELYEQRGTPLRIKKQIELVLTEHNRLNETRLNPLTTKTIQEVPAHWARPSIEMIPESESTPNVDISTVIDVISKIEPSIRLDFLENNTIKNNTIKNKRSEEHTSELQSRFDLICRLVLENRIRAY